jgi:hypothetical protein
MRYLSQQFFSGILQHDLIRTILYALANDTVRAKAFDIDPSDIGRKGEWS